jgi:hypothetical protein
LEFTRLIHDYAEHRNSMSLNLPSSAKAHTQVYIHVYYTSSTI